MQSQLKNSFLKIKINHQGAELSSIQNNKEDEYLWQGDEKYWARHSPILFPIVGMLKDNEYKYKNKTYKLSQHGFARDNNFKLHQSKKDFLSFLLQSNEETKKNYPFDFNLFISYKLIKNSIHVEYKVENKTDNEMFFSIGGHPAFNWPIEKNLKKEDYILDINLKNANHYKIFEEGVSSVENIYNKNKILLKEEIFEDDALIFSNIKNRKITYKSLKDSKSISLEFDDFPYFGIWSKPTKSPFICLEPWCGIADFKDHNKKIEDKKAIIKLLENKTFTASYTITID